MKKSILFSIILLACTYEKINAQNKKGMGFSIEKIVFHTYSCYGECPIYHIEIDSNRVTRLFAERVYTTSSEIFDKEKQGYFIGKIDDENYQKLKSLIKSVGIDTLNYGHTLCCDAPLSKLIIYYNGKRKFMKSMFPPRSTYPMLEQLLFICKNHNLTKTNEKFEIEESKK